MEADPAFREFKEQQERLYARLDEIREETNTVLEMMTSRPPTAANASTLDGLRGEMERLVQDALKQGRAFSDYVRKIEEANRRAAAMAEKRPTTRPPRSQAKIEALSGELSTNLRLERVDAAIKELLDFLGDAEFFAANTPVGRKRRLRTLKTALETALPK